LNWQSLADHLPSPLLICTQSLLSQLQVSTFASGGSPAAHFANALEVLTEGGKTVPPRRHVQRLFVRLPPIQHSSAALVPTSS
jgi:hypothetical protein